MVAATRILRLAGVALVLSGTTVLPSDAQSFLDIAASVKDRVVPPRPSPGSVPEFILIAEMANQNRRTSPRPPPGSVPEFVLIAESVHGGGGGASFSHPDMQHTTALFEVPNKDILPTTPSPPEMITEHSGIDTSNFSRPDHEAVTQPIPAGEEVPVGPSPTSEESHEEDFDVDKIYFEEWDKKVGDPR